MRHIAAEDVIFANARTGADPALAEQGECHIDAAYGGEDFSAFTICNKKGDTYYIFGKLWRKHIDECLPKIAEYRAQFNAGRIWCEDNGDKGYLAKELKRRGERAVPYHESQNKYLKITSYLKFAWANVVFVVGTDEEYIQQVLDYNENAEHDDAPDSLASSIRRLWKKSEQNEQYHSIFG
jgi:predicted phage terminase large subunit-like protein